MRKMPQEQSTQISSKNLSQSEVVSFDDYVSTGGRKKAREVGKARLEGKDYIVQDGDVD